MARARNIKPSFFSNELLAELPAFDRLLFIGLWCLADREGRLEDRPKRIKMELFPCDSYDVHSGLADLCAAGFVTRYQVEGHSVVEIVNFHKHQSPHGSEKDSTLPDKDGYLTVNERAKNVVLTGKSTKVHVNSTLVNVNPPLENALIPDSLIPDSPNPDPLKEPSASASVPAVVKADPLEGFAEFWIRYPKKKSKQDAEKAWKKLQPNAELRATLLTALGTQAKTPDWTKSDGQFIPLAATWLNGRRWEDEVPGPLLDKHTGFNGERDYKLGLEGNADGTFKF